MYLYVLIADFRQSSTLPTGQLICFFPRIPAGCSQVMKNLLVNLLKKDPEERLNFGNFYFLIIINVDRIFDYRSVSVF